MRYDDALFAITLAGIGLSFAYFRAAYRQWRFEKAVEARRLNVPSTAPDPASPVVQANKEKTCQVLAFRRTCSRKAHTVRETDEVARPSADTRDSPQRGGGTV